MKLREYILDKKNIYLAIYSVKSYVFDTQLLSRKDKKLLTSLIDPFNEVLINETIESVKQILKKILDDQEYLFETQVYFKPKEYNEENGPIYRPIHTSDLKQLIAMVALMHPLIYEIPSDANEWKLNLSNYSRLIPNNFYGNRVSKKPEELFKKWNEQYKKYTQKANEYFNLFHESKEYKYELKLDLKNFFPSVNPLVIYGILIEKIPVTLNNKVDVEVFKNIIYKLLVSRVKNINSEDAKKRYYGTSNVKINYTRGIAQGLPQSYFFGNICMTKISEIFEKKYSGKSVYYVDDSYIYTNISILDNEDFKDQLMDVNKQIKNMIDTYLNLATNEDTIAYKKTYHEFSEMLTSENENPYLICVHTEVKSRYTKIQDVKDGEVYLKALSREASQIGADIMSTYSEEEDETMLHRTEALLSSIEEERNNNLTNREGYAEKLERYYKFFKYREIRLRLKEEKGVNKSLFEILVGEIDNEISNNNDKFNGYKLLDNQMDAKFFFDSYKKDIWQTALSILISNTIYEHEHEHIRQYIRKIIDISYSEQLRECAYVLKIYIDYLKNNEIENNYDYYATLNNQVNKKMIQFANLNSKFMKKEFEDVKLRGLNENILSSYAICSQNFIETCKIVNLNSNRLQRMFLNAVYSKVFKVALSEDVVLSSYDKKGITYGELRALAYLRNTNCDVKKFLKWKMEIMSPDNFQNVDYTIFEVIGAYEKYVKLPENIDELILVHKYTCDVWKNGAKHLYFYTLHNQEHAVDLVKNIIKIVKTISYLKITNYDYYMLFIACYLHDISMVRIASSSDFILDTGDSVKIVTELEQEWSKSHSTIDTKNAIFKAYKLVDGYFENEIRSKHAKESAEEIRRRSDLNFLNSGVRECVAEIAESHMMDANDIYFLKGDAKKKLISYKFDKILLRFADLLDMSERRVSKPILNHNIDNMSSISAFHWVSHLLTEGYELTSNYIRNDNGIEENLSPGSIIEKVTLTIFIRLSQLSKLESCECKFGKIKEDTISNEGFEIEIINDKTYCGSDKCNFLCRWFNEKNEYLLQEMNALEAYLSRVPKKERFYSTKIVIKVVIINPTDISDEQFKIIKEKISE